MVALSLFQTTYLKSVYGYISVRSIRQHEIRLLCPVHLTSFLRRFPSKVGLRGTMLRNAPNGTAGWLTSGWAY